MLEVSPAWTSLDAGFEPSAFFFLFLPSPFPFTPVTARQLAAVVFGACLGFSAIQRSWFARVNALCNFSRKKARKVAAATSGPVFEKASVHPVYNNGRLT